MSLFRLRMIVLTGLTALILLASPVAGQATVVRMLTSLGVVDVALYDEQAPLAVANFLNYVNRGAYDNSFIHRSAPGFVIQGGGYAWDSSGTRMFKIPGDPPVVNEFSANRSNLRGTVAMAKLPEDPDSATTEWFVNLADNAANLDKQNGGFTVFGQVMGNGMAVLDAMAGLQRVNAGSPFTELPLVSFPADRIIRQGNLVMISSMAVLPTTSATDSDRLFNYLEATFPQYVAPASQPSATAFGYFFRYYPATNAYLGTRAGMIYYAGPASSDNVLALGTLAEWVERAAAAGY